MDDQEDDDLYGYDKDPHEDWRENDGDSPGSEYKPTKREMREGYSSSSSDEKMPKKRNNGRNSKASSKSIGEGYSSSSDDEKMLKKRNKGRNSNASSNSIGEGYSETYSLHDRRQTTTPSQHASYAVQDMPATDFLRRLKDDVLPAVTRTLLDLVPSRARPWGHSNFPPKRVGVLHIPIGLRTDHPDPEEFQSFYEMFTGIIT